MQNTNFRRLRLFPKLFLMFIQSLIISPLLPLTLTQLNRPIPHILPIHLFQGNCQVSRISKANKSIPFGLPTPLVPHNPSHVERREPCECLGEDVIVDLVAEVAAEEAVVVFGPVGEGGVLPGEAGGAAREGFFLGLGLVFDVAAGDGGFYVL